MNDQRSTRLELVTPNGTIEDEERETVVSYSWFEVLYFCKKWFGFNRSRAAFYDAFRESNCLRQFITLQINRK
jgi:hypothetical protein